MFNWKWDISLAVLAAAVSSPDFAVSQTTAPADSYTRGAPQAVAADYYAAEYYDGAQQPMQPASLGSAGYEPQCAAPAVDSCTSGYDDCGAGCASCGSSCGLGGGLFGPCCEHGDAWTLFPEFCDGSTMGGWVSGGIYSNAHGRRGVGGNGPLGFRDLAGEGALNQAWFFAGREADGQCGLDWGYRVDYVFGIDGPDTQAFGQNSGYDTDWDSSSRYGSALPQLYGEVAYGDLSVKFGHFFTIIGYEVVAAPGNFFTSSSYTQYYGEPFTHTGVLAEYAYSEDVTLYGGYTFGWDTGFDDGGNGATFLGGVGLQLTDDLKATYASNFGNFNEDLGGGDVYMQSLVFDLTLTERTNYVFQTDYGTLDQADGRHNWYGINQYLFYTINDCWSAGARFEWFDDEDGARVGNGSGDYYALTSGVNWKPHANIVVRPELRYDWFDGGADGVNPFDEGNADEQFSGGFDVIFTY